MKKLSKEEAIEKIKSKYDLIEIDNYKGIYNTKCVVKCNNCFSIRTSLIYNLFKWEKCIKCRNPIKKSTDEIERIASKNNFKLLSNYKGDDKYIKFQCLSCGYLKELKQAKNIKNLKCNNCQKRYKKYNKKVVEKILNENNFTLLSEYINGYTQILIKCKNNHENNIKFFDFLKGIKKNQTNCKKCHIQNSIKNIEEVILDIKKHSPNIKIIENTYHGVGKNSDFICYDCGLKWNAKVNPIRLGLMSCPHCSKHLNEKLTGEYIKEIYRLDNIPRKHYLKCNEGFQKNLWVDYSFYYKNKLIFVEYNGAQHYRPLNFGYASEEQMIEAFKRQKKRDIYLRKYCKNNNIILIEIDGRKYEKLKIKDYLLKQKEIIDNL